MKQTHINKNKTYFIVLLILGIAFLVYFTPFRAEAATYSDINKITVDQTSYVGIAVSPMLESINSDDNWVIRSLQRERRLSPCY